MARVVGRLAKQPESGVSLLEYYGARRHARKFFLYHVDEEDDDDDDDYDDDRYLCLDGRDLWGGGGIGTWNCYPRASLPRTIISPIITSI